MKFNLTKTLFLAAVVAVAGVFSSTASAQQTPGRICVLDVAKVFKDNATFQSEMEKIRKEAESLKSNVEQQFAALQKQAENLQNSELKVDAPERRQRESELVQQQAVLQTKARQAEADLLTREAKAYLKTYREMEAIVAKIAEENNVSMVLRYESAPINEEDRNDVIKGVNRQVVYQKYSDLTNMVHQQMSGTASNTTGTQKK